MLFNSLDFAIFFCIVTICYFLLPYRHRWWMLLAAICYFYMAFIPIYIFILAFIILVDYITGILVENANGAKRLYLLFISIIANLSILGLFKYYNFITETFNLPSTSFSNLVLPIGLSFHTFQSMSYNIEIYRGHQKAVRHLGQFALFVMFYPQLVAGPIERPQNLLSQLQTEQYFNSQRVASGLQLMTWGLFKKVVIADRLAILVNTVYANPSQYTGFELLIATFFFTFQIYCDFSGYSDIALGAAQVMGFTLMQNFRRPYLATSISDFWSRWHISLSTWFRDYLYIPLGGNRVGLWRWQFNLLFVFLVSGLWHGASWTFVLWGALHGLYLIAEIWLGKLASSINQAINLKKLHSLINPTILRNVTCLLKRCVVFIFVMLAWVFFRAENLQDSVYIISHVSIANANFNRISVLIGGNIELLFAFALIWGLLVVEIYQQHSLAFGSLRRQIQQLPLWSRFALYYLSVMMILILGKFFNAEADFIYFQF